MSSRKTPLLEAPHLKGRDYTEAHCQATDRWFRNVAEEALEDLSGISLIAVGGYGRGRLSPFSDIDVVLVHADEVDSAEVAEALWYPVWDRGLKMGYAVVNLEQAKKLLTEEFEWSTALLDTRLIAGNPELHHRLDELTNAAWSEGGDRLLSHLAEVVKTRHKNRGDVAFQIEPNLKEGRGGLRDLHALGWADRAQPGFAADLLTDLSVDVDTLLEARVELHRLTNRPGDILTLDNQDGVAAALGDDDGQELMLRLALAARRIAWHSDEAWSRWDRAKRFTSPVSSNIECSSLADTSQFESRDGLVAIGPNVEASRDPLLLLKLAVISAESGLVMSRTSLAELQQRGGDIDQYWSSEARRLFAALFLAGRSAIAVVEDLNQFGLMQCLVPEWGNVLCQPQRNVLHTFTVDRHLCEAASNASALSDRVARPDLLVVGALFHDIGKGFPGDHTEVGIKIITKIGERMGYPDEDVAALVDLCRHHLLLPDVATRRDLSDPGTIRAVAASVDSVDFLHLLAALTEADSAATGPSAWGSWKAGLLADLVARTADVLDGAQPEDVTGDDFPTPEVSECMAQGSSQLHGTGTTFTVVVPERLGLFSMMAGVLAVSGLEVLDASAYSEDADRMPSSGTEGHPEPSLMAACQFVLQPPQSGFVDWQSVIDTAQQALDGRLALEARVARRAREQARYRRRLSADPPRRDIVIDNDISDLSTVIEVHAPDEIGLLYRLTQVFRELQLDIRTAKIQTLGPQAVDSFYLRTVDDNKITDQELVAELRLALRETIT